jgi:hypothetical protein
MSTPVLGVSYFGNRYPGHAREDLRAIAATGASIVVHAMSEADSRWNPGTMGTLVEIGSEFGLESWLTPWGLGGAFGGETASYGVMEYPEDCQRDNFGRALPALCPLQPAFRQTASDWLDAAASTGAKVVVWDEPHFAVPWPRGGENRWACRCERCQERFQSRFDRPMPVEWDNDVAEFTFGTLFDTVVWLIEQASARDLESGVILLPDESVGDRGWRELAALPGVRTLGVPPYWVFQGVPEAEIESYVRRWCERAVAATQDVSATSLAWVQAFSVPAGRESEISRGMEIMQETGIDMIAVWAYRACEAMSGLAPDNPSLVWETVLNEFDRIRSDPSVLELETWE